MGQDGTWIEPPPPEPTPQRVAALVAMDLDGEYSETLEATMNVTSFGNVIDIELEWEDGEARRYRLRVEEAAA